MKVLLVAIPLMARSGVYRSAHELVRAARKQEMSWSAILGVRSSASGEPLTTPGVREFEFSEHGLGSIRSIARIIDSAPEVSDADVIITMISQSDIAMSGSRSRGNKHWVAWVRGKPWPAKGEQPLHRRVALHRLETAALRKADDVWATTSVLASQFASARLAHIVPAGIAPLPRLHDGTNREGPLVWAGRVDTDKRPELFIEIVKRTGHPGCIYGEGPLVGTLSKDSPTGVSWAGWAPAEALWTDASIFVGTSYREAFGRSAVEAASAGLPVVLDSAYGAAPLLVTDPEIAKLCIVNSPDPAEWARVIEALLNDDVTRRAVSEHVHANAQLLTIGASVRSVQARLQASPNDGR